MDILNFKINVANILDSIKMHYYDFYKCKIIHQGKSIQCLTPQIKYFLIQNHHVKFGGHEQPPNPWKSATACYHYSSNFPFDNRRSHRK